MFINTTPVDAAAIKYFGCFAHLNFPGERNIVQVGGENYKMSYLANETEVKWPQKEIAELKKMTRKDTLAVLRGKTVAELGHLCRILSCGVDELAAKLKKECGNAQKWEPEQMDFLNHEE